MQFEQMSSIEVDAFYQYAEALYEGRIRPPEGVQIGSSVEETIRHMMQMFLVLRVVDHNSALAVYQAMQAADVRLVDAAMKFIGNPKLH